MEGLVKVCKVQKYVSVRCFELFPVVPVTRLERLDFYINLPSCYTDRQVEYHNVFPSTAIDRFGGLWQCRKSYLVLELMPSGMTPRILVFFQLDCELSGPAGVNVTIARDCLQRSVG